MSRETPVRSEGGMHDDYAETHPAYAMIGASRVTSSRGVALFGSDFLHQNFMVIRVKRAQLNRSLSHDWIHGREELIEVILSEAQWATFLSSPNIGDGVACTLSRVGKDQMPSIEPDATRRDQFRSEIDDHLKDGIETIEAVIANGKLTKKDRESLEHAKMQLASNLSFVSRSFDEHAEKTVEKAKAEVAAYITGAIQRAGLQTLGGAEPLTLTMTDE